MAALARRDEGASVRLVLVHGPRTAAELWQPLTDLVADDPELGARVRVSHLHYGAAPARGNGALDEAATQLATHLRDGDGSGDPVLLVTHGQGGLVVQRFLARALDVGWAGATTRVHGVVMFACPNHGSRLLPHLWRRLRSRRDNSYRQVRMAPGPVRAARRAVLRGLVERRDEAHAATRLPVFAYGGDADQAVPAAEATGPFASGGVLPGDHRSLVRPADRDAPVYRVVRDRLLAALPQSPEEAHRGPAARDGRMSVAPPYGRMEGRLHGGDRQRVITAVLSEGADVRLHVLAGAGGTGKSRLALEIARRADRTGRRVWWIAATQVTAGMREVANQLGAPAGLVEQAFRGDGSATDLVWRFLDSTSRPWLLVIDDADDPERLGPLEGRLSDSTGWLRRPAAAHGLVVVTSTDNHPDNWVPGTRVHPVSPLNEEDGGSLLREFAPGGGTIAQARALSTQLGGLPLALRAAAAYVKATRSDAITLREPTIQDFDSYREALRARFHAPPGTGAGRRDDSLGLEAMTKVCDLALSRLAEEDLAEAAPLLKTFACLSTAPIPYRMLLNSSVLSGSPLFADFPLARREAVLRGLVRFGLVEITRRATAGEAPSDHSLALSPVVHGLLREDPDVRSRRSDYHGLITRLLLDVADPNDPDQPDSWPVWSAIAPHTIEAARTALTAGSGLADRVLLDALELARRTARYLIVFGLLRPARQLTRPIIVDCTGFGFVPNDREILRIRHEAGRICLEAGELAEAEAELRLVLAARERVLGPEHEDTLASAHKLARSLLEQARNDEAMSLLRSVVAAEQRVRGPEHSDTMTVRHSWARTMWAAGDRMEAERELRDVLAVSLRHWAPTRFETLRIRNTLARWLLYTDRPEEAEEVIESALRDAVGIPDSPAVLTLRDTRCRVRLDQGRYEESVTELGQLVDDRIRVLGPGSPETRRTQTFLNKIQGASEIASNRTGGLPSSD